MASQDYLQTRSLNKKGIARNVVDDTAIALRIIHIDPESSVTSVVIAGTSTSLVLTDSDAATTIDISAAAYDTLGELADYINTLDNWRCKILDGLRTDSVNGTLVDNAGVTAKTINGVTCYDLLSDTSALKAYTYRLAYNRLPVLEKTNKIHRVHLREIKYYADVNAAAADGVQVWECKGTDETQVYSGVSVDTTATTINWGGGIGYISGGEGADLVIRVKDATTLTNHTSGSLRISGDVE
jgi:hypothetical protein